MEKKELRQKYKSLRAALSKEKIDLLSMEIANQTLQLPIWELSFYHLFLSIEKQHEINTEYILHILQGKDKNTVLSKSNFGDNTLTHFLLTDSTVIKPNFYGIPEPIEGIPIADTMLQVVFIPLLAYDLHGNRVGYGKGFYDRFLSNCNSETVKIGLSFFEPEQNIRNVSPQDIQLDYCVTPTSIYTY